MNENETLTLPITGKTVIIKGYVSGLVDQEVKRVMMSGFKIETSVSDLESSLSQAENNVQLDLGKQIEADSKLLELMLVAVDGNNGAALLDQLLALPKTDVDFVMAKVKELQSAGEVKASDPKAPQS